MADENLSVVYTLGLAPGIKRDGTVFESRECTDGLWNRFQRGTPRKIGGYSRMFLDKYGIARGIIANAYNGQNFIFTGTEETIDAFTTSLSFAAGTGPSKAVINVGYAETTVTSNTSSTFVVTGDLTTKFPATTKVVFSQTPGATQYTVSGSVFAAGNTTVTVTPTSIPASQTEVWIANVEFDPNPANLWQFDMQYDSQGGSMKVIAHPGQNLINIVEDNPTQVLVGDILPTGATWNFYGLADTEGNNPTFAPVTCDGGVVMLYPFLFIYGSDGFIANNHVDAVFEDQSLNNWNGTLANRVNMAAGKIVKGMPVRGGTNSPSGLFWATDSLIRVSFTGDVNQYWKYDIISSQISIMSSNAVVEMDGVYFWMGVDRFYMYNGSVQVLPNDKNLNWVYDNLNFAQRQKVWATKVPRFNEIWFFYPRGTSTECNDAIIYNVKDKVWYDAGSANGAYRSCGYTTEVFPTPIWCGWEYDFTVGQPDVTIATPAGEPAPTSSQFYLDGDVTPKYSPNKTIQFTNLPSGTSYLISTVVYDPASNSTLVTVTEVISPYPSVGDSVFPTTSGYAMWQHEIGTDRVEPTGQTAIPAYFTTCDISWVGGNPAQDELKGINRRLHLRRVEPDFVQSGEMTLEIIGKPFAQSTEVNSPVFTFTSDTGKVDLRIENRETRLKFGTNVAGGSYQMGRVLITAELGDERP
jgi:hypothetical protein